ncbi:MAG: TatD family hydrolase [Candidatus Accumulibacter sp.]|nr:TatD family hydrolase [Accumulibacter sp.]
MLIDTHCHIDAAEFAGDRDAVVRAAAAAGIVAIVVPSVMPENFAAVRVCCERHVLCRPAYGTHPLRVDSTDETALGRLRACLEREMAGAHPPAAVGEIGLDFHVPGFDAARQERFFVEQLKIARDFDLPVLLHIRRAVDAVLRQLRRIGARGGIAHAFNGSRQQADEFLRLGFRLGFGGAMSFPRATRIRRLASSLPREALVLETDAPDIPPAWLEGGRNTPAELLRIADALAELRGIDRAEVESFTTDNAVAVLGFRRQRFERTEDSSRGQRIEDRRQFQRTEDRGQKTDEFAALSRRV